MKSNKIAKSEKKKEKKKNHSGLPYGLTGRILLGAVATVGIMSIALAAPNIFQAVRAFEKMKGKSYRRYRSPAHVRKIINQLEKRKMIYIYEKGDETLVRLTEKGKRELLKYKLKEKSLKKWHWDKKWRMLVFDIEEKKRIVRDYVRENMVAFGFVKLQNSVWVYPYECEELISLLKAEYKLDKELLYIVADKIENEEWLKKKFRL